MRGFQNGVLLTLEWSKKVEGVEEAAVLFNEYIYDYEHSFGLSNKNFLTAL